MVEWSSKKALFLLFVVPGPTFTLVISKYVHAFKTQHSEFNLFIIGMYPWDCRLYPPCIPILNDLYWKHVSVCVCVSFLVVVVSNMGSIVAQADGILQPVVENRCRASFGEPVGNSDRR